jgi:hypothetical protein
MPPADASRICQSAPRLELRCLGHTYDPMVSRARTILEAFPLGMPQDTHGPCDPRSINLRGLGACIGNSRRHCLAAHVSGQGGVANEACLAGRVAHLPAWIAPLLSSGLRGQGC